MKLILLSGKQGAGKTTVQNALIDYYRPKMGCAAPNFADVLYEMHDAVQGVLGKYRPSLCRKKDGALLQVLGTDWGRRTLGDQVWIDILRARIEYFREVGNGMVVVGDCRFRNEFEAFPEALRVRLDCDRETRRRRCTAWRDNDQHASETDLDDFDIHRKFDLYLNTGEINVYACVMLIAAQIDKNVWKEKRI